MAAELMVEDGRIAGAITLNVRTGELAVIRAKSVILSAGGTAVSGCRPTETFTASMIFRATPATAIAWLTGPGRIERIRVHPALLHYQGHQAPLLYITLTGGAHLINAFGERRDKAHPSIKSMCMEDFFDHSGPLRIRMDHLPEEKIREIEDILFTTERPACERFHSGRDNDFRTGEIELWPTEVYLCGGHGMTGVLINENGESSVPGLFAAGDTSLCARGHLSGAFVYGEICAESASEHAASVSRADFSPAQIDAFSAKRQKRLNQGENPVAVEEFEYKVRRIISDYLPRRKMSTNSNGSLWWMERFRSELDEVVFVRDQHDLFKTFEVENIIQCAALSATASLERTESRWLPWHYRSDFPEKDDTNWLKHIVVTQGAQPGEIDIQHKDIIKMADRGGA